MKGEGIAIRKEGLTFLEPFFSVREFSLIDRISLYPMTNEDELFGLFLNILHEEDTSTNESQELGSQISRISKSVYREYVERLMPVANGPEMPVGVEIRDLVDRSVIQAREYGYRLVFICVDTMPLLSTVSHFVSDINLLRLREDVQQILNSLLSDGGFVVPYGQDRLLMCIRTKHSFDPQFLLTHIETTFEDFFPDKANLSEALLKSTGYPDPAQHTNEILELLSVEA